MEAALYFCCLEALHNAAKHAGDRARITVTLRHDTSELVCEITDDGTGLTSTSTSTSTGAGLANMADRIAAVGGQLRIDSAPGRGTTIRATAPARRSTSPGTAGQPGSVTRPGRPKVVQAPLKTHWAAPCRLPVASEDSKAMADVRRSPAWFISKPGPRD